MQKKWILHSVSDKNKVDRLKETLHIPDALAGILLRRGVKSYEEAQSFFKPVLEDIHDPYLMQDMEKSVYRIEKAIEDKEKILVFGDYDVDGTTAVALVYSFLRDIVAEIAYYVPDRYEEGYGISMQSIEYAKENGFSLIIALDCGVNAHQAIGQAVEYGIDVIVCDHHLPGKSLPKAYAVLDPKRKDCKYPYKELSGCGVGFKLVHAIAKHRKISFKKIGQYFDLVALSIASDVVPLTGENRVFAYFGLKLINIRPRRSIEALLAFSKITRKTSPIQPSLNTIFARKVSLQDLVFYVGPRLNAAGRMTTGRSSVHLLISSEPDTIVELGERVDKENTERRELDAKITKEASAMVLSMPDWQERKSIVVYDPSWSKGVIGIVASRLVEQFYKPSVVLTLNNNIITGSARSVKDFDIYIALSQCSGLLEHFGGHTFAAGLTIKQGNLSKFMTKFEQIVASTIPETATIPAIEIDEEIPLHVINMNFLTVMNKFAPFGPENTVPLFMTRRVTATNARIVGDNHLKLSLIQNNSRNRPIGAVGFGIGEHLKRITQGESFHICYHIELNEWQGENHLQLNIKDIKFSSDNADIIIEN
ncbi:MAG: single-stranded-DNA-specific exonuclease RecJ [Bacteroidales bacterium]|jgi:single-stranded-DNA-specific exonuclease|nr:single-stranded-DNA-specific exonuclease RecJ [Bacteroidales bacterium]